MKSPVWAMKAKQRLLREINELMYEYGDDEVCIELEGDGCISIALCCDENKCYTTTLKC